MELTKGLLERKSIRGFKKDPVKKEIIEEILNLATRVPSQNNSQPWEFAVVTGEALEKIANENVRRFLKNDELDHPDQPFEGVYRERQVEVAKQLFASMGIERHDKEKRLAWMQRGFRFFDAQVLIILLLDESLDESLSRFDMGCAAQNICLAAMEYGLGTCIEDQAIMYNSSIREILHIPDRKKFVTGIALGYPDPDFPANNVTSPRTKYDEITTWYGFSEK